MKFVDDCNSGSSRVSHVSFDIAVTSAPVYILNVIVLPFTRSKFHTFVII